MIETQRTITEWAWKQFGVPKNTFLIVGRANQEASEMLTLMIANHIDNPAPISPEDLAQLKGELADIMIVLFQVGELKKFDLFQVMAEIVVTQFGTNPLQDAVAINKCFSTMIKTSEEIYRLQARILEQNLPIILKYNSGIIAFRVKRICNFYNIDLEHEIDYKMKINRARKWKITATGIGQHVDG